MDALTNWNLCVSLGKKSESCWSVFGTRTPNAACGRFVGIIFFLDAMGSGNINLFLRVDQS